MSLSEIEEDEVLAGTLDEFTFEQAWELGTLARDIVASEYPDRSVVIDISLSNGQILFHSVIGASTTIDNDQWVRRKSQTVFRFGKSSWYMGQKLKLKGKSVKEGLYVHEEDYACHGGSVPIRLSNFDAVVAALTISGLAQQEDHELALKILRKFKMED